MKTEQFTNWFKLMCGLSMLIVSTCFLINTIGPLHAIRGNEKGGDGVANLENKRNDITNIDNIRNASMGVIIGDYAYFVDGGFLYRLRASIGGDSYYSNPEMKSNWKKIRLTTLPESQLK